MRIDPVTGQPMGRPQPKVQKITIPISTLLELLLTDTIAEYGSFTLQFKDEEFIIAFKEL